MIPSVPLNDGEEICNSVAKFALIDFAVRFTNITAVRLKIGHCINSEYYPRSCKF